MKSQVTIVRPDNTVIVDGKPHWVDCSSLPAYVRVVQWDGEAGKGHIEFVQDPHGKFMPNTAITDFAPYTSLTDAWTEAEQLEQRKAKLNADAKAHEKAAAKALR